MSKSKMIADPMLQAALKAGAREIVVQADGKDVVLRIHDPESEIAEGDADSILERLAKNDRELAALSNGVAIKNLEPLLAIFGSAITRVSELLGVVQADQRRIIELLEADVVPQYGADGRVKKASRVAGKPS